MGNAWLVPDAELLLAARPVAPDADRSLPAIAAGGLILFSSRKTSRHDQPTIFVQRRAVPKPPGSSRNLL